MDKKETLVCNHCGAEADMTLEGFESIEEVIKREKKLTCKKCRSEIPWTEREDLKAVKIAMEAEKEAFQTYSRLEKKTRNPKGKDMFHQLSEFEMNHYQKLKELFESLEKKGEWILYEGTTFKKRNIPIKMEVPKAQDQLSDLDAIKIAIKEEKKARAFYSSLAEITKDVRGKNMYKRLSEEEALHEKILNDQYYSLHNTGIWSWGD